MSFWQAIVLSIVEGLTEFLPISSTGHIILASSMMGIEHDAWTKDYTVMVQFGSILSVVVVYWKTFFESFEFYKKILIGVVPALVIGFLVKSKIDVLLESTVTVAISLLVWGIVLMFIDRIKLSARYSSMKQVSPTMSLKVGLIQCLAFIPGTSRSAATIVGALIQGFDRKLAAEFSFFLAVPTLTAATAYKFKKALPTLLQSSNEQWMMLIAGNIVSFIVALLTIRFFMKFVQQKGLFYFGIYRVIVGIVILALIASGHSLQIL